MTADTLTWSMTGGVAIYRPPATVRVRKGNIRTTEGGLAWADTGGLFSRTKTGVIPWGAIRVIRHDADGSVVVAYLRNGSEEDLAFWPGDRSHATAESVAQGLRRLVESRAGPGHLQHSEAYDNDEDDDEDVRRDAFDEDDDEDDE